MYVFAWLRRWSIHGADRLYIIHIRTNAQLRTAIYSRASSVILTVLLHNVTVKSQAETNRQCNATSNTLAFDASGATKSQAPATVPIITAIHQGLPIVARIIFFFLPYTFIKKENIECTQRIYFSSKVTTRNVLDCDQSNYSSRIIFSVLLP